MEFELNDINGAKIVLGSRVKYVYSEGCSNHCLGIVKFGEFEQETFSSAFAPIKILGVYIEREQILPSQNQNGLEIKSLEEREEKTISILETTYLEVVEQ